MKVIVNGALGRMGMQVADKVIAGFADAKLSALVDYAGDGRGVLSKLADCKADADVIIDFSHHSASGELADFAVSRNIPLVVATTGQTEEEMEALKKASASVPVFYSANMSVGVALLVELAKRAAQVRKDADIEIIEKHHNRKIDAPSGTALMIADGIRTVRKELINCPGRSGIQKREPSDIGLHAVRLGGVIGEHEVLIATESQTITLKHEAHSRALFAEGALTVAKFLCTQKAGFYAMQDMLA